MSRVFGSMSPEVDGAYRLLRTDEYGNLCVRPPTTGVPTQRWLTEAGDGTGNHEAIGNYSVTPVDFFYTVPDAPNNAYDIHTVIICITDGNTLNYNDYGSLASGIVTTGIRLLVYIHSIDQTLPLLSNAYFKYNYQFVEISSSAAVTSFSGTVQTLKVVIDIPSMYGVPLRLSAGDKFIVRCADNFTGLVAHSFNLGGIQQILPVNIPT